MKKSTLFFKVMVLLALLVPWTSWGQIAPIAGDDGIWGHGPTIYINDEGQISSDGETYSNNVTIQFSDVQDQNEGNWKFGEEIEPDNLPITVTPSEDGTQVTLAVKEGTKVSDITEVKFKIAAVNNGGQRKGWIEFGLVAGKTNISDEESITISINGDSDSKIYDGGTISISVTTTDGTSLVMGTDYQVYIDDNTTAIATEDGLPKNVKEGDTEAAYSIVIEGIGDDYCGKTEAKEVTIKKRPITVTLKDSPKLEFKIGDAATNLNAEDYASYFNIQENITDAGLAENEYAKVSGTFSVNTESAREVAIDTESLSLVDKDNSGFNATNYNITWGGDNGLKVTVSKKDFSDIESGGTISVTQDGKTYDGTAISAPEVKDSETTLEKDKDYTVTYKDENEKDLEKAPSNAGTYTVVITPTESGDYEGSPIEKNFTISKAKVTVAGTLTITEGDKLKDSYKFDDIKDLKADGIVEGEEETVKAAITITPKNKENPTASDDAFTITLAETVINYTISEESKIALVVEEDPDKWQEGEAKAEETVYVNEEGQLKYDEDRGYGSSVNITLKGISELAGWSFVLEENPEEDFDVLAVMSGDEVVMEGLSWATLITTDKVITGLQVSSENKNSIYESLTESKSVKVRLEKDGADGYLLITFKQGESTEEPGGDDEDMTWAENKKASITVYVNAETGKVIKSEPAMESEGVIDLDKVNSELSGWAYATEDSKPIIVDEESISSVYTFVMDNENLVVGPTKSFDAEGLPDAVKVKIENEENVGYLEVAFEKIIVIDPSDITGGDDDDENGEIDENGNLLGTAEGEKTVYDSETHELAILKVNGLYEPLRVGEDYTVVYTAQESGDLVDDLPYHAGTYNVTITLGDKYITTTGAKEFATTVEITKRDLHLAFSIEENAKIEDLNEKLDLTEGLVICTPENLAQNDKLAGVITATFTIGQEPVDGLYPVYPETIHFENTENFNYTDYNISYDYTDLTGIEHQEEITPDEDGDVEIGDGEGEIPADDPIGGIEYVNPETGEGSAGGYYEKKYRLYLAVKDKNSYYVEDAEADYAAEGLELFSRHDKKTTWAGGSFTVWYEHNKVANEGGYRVFIKRGKHADYEEVKLDEVSGYYQIRNVQSDIYVRLYFGTGFPVANEEITATDARAYTQANKIVVITPEPTDVQIISMAGAVVATDQVTGQREFANLAEGVYIVRMGETVIKLQVRN